MMNTASTVAVSESNTVFVGFTKLYMATLINTV